MRKMIDSTDLEDTEIMGYHGEFEDCGGRKEEDLRDIHT